jgi:hypothetical protein
MGRGCGNKDSGTKINFEKIILNCIFVIHSETRYTPVASESHHFIINLPHKVYPFYFYKNAFMLLL